MGFVSSALSKSVDKFPYLDSFPSRLPLTPAKMYVRGIWVRLQGDLEEISLQYLKCATKSCSRGRWC